MGPLAKDILNIVAKAINRYRIEKCCKEFKVTYYINYDVVWDFAEPKRKQGQWIEWYYDVKLWYFDGKLHRPEREGPALVDDDCKQWCMDGKLHRLVGPAIEWINGTKEYWINGQMRREGGPGIEYYNGQKEFWVNGRWM